MTSSLLKCTLQIGVVYRLLIISDETVKLFLKRTVKEEMLVPVQDLILKVVSKELSIHGENQEPVVAGAGRASLGRLQRPSRGPVLLKNQRRRASKYSRPERPEARREAGPLPPGTWPTGHTLRLRERHARK